MNIFQRIANLFKGSSGRNDRTMPIYVFSHRCKEPLAGRVDLFNELSMGDDENEDNYHVRKVLHTTGANRCFDQVEVNLWFNKSKNLVEHDVTGGRWLTAEEYEIELARFNQPDEDEADATGDSEAGKSTDPGEQTD